MSEGLSSLFSLIKINGMDLKNRAVMPPMGTGFGNPDGTVSDRLVQYFARRARGGVGLIITGVIAIDPRGKAFPNAMGVWKDEFIEGLAMIPTAIHREGSKVAAQLHHGGATASVTNPGQGPEAPSATPVPGKNHKIEVMTIERIQQLVEAFGDGALRIKRAGYDALEIHGGHMYLVNQFLSPFFNRRTDEYGGSDENRSRFAIEIVQKVRKKVGADFPILFRVSADELFKDGYKLPFIEWLAPRLVDAGVDAIHVSIGGYFTPGNPSLPSPHFEPGFNLFRARAIKQVVDVPVIGAVGIGDPRLADEAIARGDADLIAFGRQQICDPDLINKAREGRFDDIRWCLKCNLGCQDRLLFENKSIACVLNPEVGREYLGPKLKCDAPKKVWVVGAGPAGLTASLTLVRRGHQVQIFEQHDLAGGQLRVAAKPTAKELYDNYVPWIERQLEKEGVKIQFGTKVSEKMICERKPEVVILATGAVPVVPKIPGIKSEHVIDAHDLLMGLVEVAEGPIVVLGGGYVGMETAEVLVAKNLTVTVLEMLERSPVSSMNSHGWWLHHRLRETQTRLILGAKVTRIEQNAVVFIKNGEEQRIAPVSTVVMAMGVRSENKLANVLDKKGVEYRIIGDAKTPRRLLEAVEEGYMVGCEYG